MAYGDPYSEEEEVQKAQQPRQQNQNPYSSVAPQTSQTYYQNQPNSYQQPQQQRRNPQYGNAAIDTYQNRDWSQSVNRGAFDSEYNRLLQQGKSPEEARRIVSTALGGMEHDWQQYKGTPLDQKAMGEWGGQSAWVDMFARGEGQRDPSCPPDAPYKDPASPSGQCVEKPWDHAEDNPNRIDWSQPQYQPKGPGPKQLRKMGMTREQYNAQNPGNYPTGANTPAGSGSSPGDLALYQVKQQYAEALADPTGQKAWQLFTGQGGEKTFQNTMDKMQSQIAGMPAGPARDYAENQLREMQTNMRLQLPQQARAASIAGLQGVINPELGYVQSERDRKLQQFIANTNRELGFGNLGLGQQGLNLQAQGQAWNQNVMFPWQVAQAGAGNWLNQYGTQYPAQQAQNQANSGALGGLINAGVDAFGNYLQNRQNQGGTNVSDIRAKEDIAPGRRGLTDLLKLRTHTYRYKGTPKVTQSVMAQDLEKIAPEFVVEDPSGLKMVDSYGLLGMTMQAVKELAKKVEKS